MVDRTEEMRDTWQTSFEEQVAREAYNTAPVEALVRNVSYYLRDRFMPEQRGELHFAEMGSGAGPNLVWLAEKGIKVSGVDIAPITLQLAREALERHGLSDRLGTLAEASVTDVPFDDESLDGVLESCVFQHLSREDRESAFREVDRVTKPGGVFVGHMLDQAHTVFQAHRDEQDPEDPGTLRLEEGGSNFYLTNIGLSHFFSADEFRDLLPGWSVVDPCLTQYELPQSEAEKRGYPRYLQSMHVVYAIK